MSKPYNNGEWTEARFRSFIVSALRSATGRWGPKQICIKNARVARGKYKCEGCGVVGPATLPPKEGNKRRIKNIVADHILPVVDPRVGFTTYDEWVERCFVEVNGYQALCNDCHVHIKTKKEREVATKVNALKKTNQSEYQSWVNMLYRCNNKKATGYEHYGGRGIRVCDEWLDFEVFLQDMGARPSDTSIDRIDVDGDYALGNCRWATRRQQALNRGNNHHISHKGVCKTVSEWAEDLGIKQNTLLYRIRRGWSKDEYLKKNTREPPSTSRIDDDTWKEVAAMRLQGVGVVELGNLFNIDSSQISRKTNKLFSDEEKVILEEIRLFKNKYKSGEEREQRKKYR